MIVAHLADLHIGYSHLTPRAPDSRNQRMVDFEHAALSVADHLVKVRPDVVVVAGDLLHETQLYPTALRGAAEFCRRLRKADIPLVAIGGNHDEAEGQGRYNALTYLSDQHGLDLHLGQSHQDMCGVRFHFVSFRVISRSISGRGEIQPFEFSSSLPNVLVSHGYHPGNGVAEIPEEREVKIPSEWLSDPRFDACLLGHIHHHTRLTEKAFYAGSTERRNFGESGERPGFWLHHLSASGLDKSESVFVDEISDSLPRPMIDKHLDCYDMTIHELDQRVKEIIKEEGSDGVMMRILLENVSAELDRAQAKAEWERMFKKQGGFSFEAVPRTKRMTELLDINFEEAPQDVGEGFLEYVQEASASLDAQETQEIKRIAATVVADAREAILAQEVD